MDMSTHRYAGLAALLALTLAGCLQPPDYPVEPVLTFEGLSRDTMLQGFSDRDSIRVFLSFTDGDGDITPEAGSTVPNFYLENLETGQVVNNFLTDPIPEEGVSNGISGEISLRVFTTCCEYPNDIELPCTPSTRFPVDTLLLEAYLIDRAGNESNRVPLSPIYLLCDR